jgi:hypothetical protein
MHASRHMFPPKLHGTTKDSEIHPMCLQMSRD